MTSNNSAEKTALSVWHHLVLEESPTNRCENVPGTVSRLEDRQNNGEREDGERKKKGEEGRTRERERKRICQSRLQ